MIIRKQRDEKDIEALIEMAESGGIEAEIHL